MFIKAAILGFVIVAASALPSPAADVWYEDNNLGKGGVSMPTDFVEKFRQPESFSEATKYIRVYMVRAQVMEAMDDQFLTTSFNQYLKGNSIKLAIDAGGATWAQAGARGKVATNELGLLKRLQGLGVKVDYISLQSVLSKPLIKDGEERDYPMSMRIEDIVKYSKAIRAIYPQVEIGIIDALPSHGKDYQQPYRQLKNALTREGIELSYIHLDMPFELIKEQHHGITWQRVREVERYVEDELRVKFGLLATSSKGGHNSSKAYHHAVMAALMCYSGADGTPHDFIIASWFSYPEKTIPETATGDDYPTMRTVKEFGRQLDRIEKNGARSVFAGQSSWAAMCER